MTTAVQSNSNENIVWHNHQVDKALRAQQKSQKPCVLWFTGLSGAGKSTIAGALESRLSALGYHTYLLDGDNVRHGLCKDLGFSAEDRRENIRRIGEVAKLMTDAGLIVLSAFISPHRHERQLVRDMLPEGEFLEVFVDTPLDECEKRDPKGLYKKARAGQIKHFTGIDAEYEQPENAEIHLSAGSLTVEQLVERCIISLQEQNIVG
ncbi:adenylyl-sulfate kinase [Photobacterium nomapromontoriensis]|uniref:adenylyl-sulfate kinase n=1 Tax=Photobacterium nomapromontoriensis TaxID=2910237 RepID=UPI003D0F422E